MRELKKFTVKQKESILNEWVESGCTLDEIGKKYKIHPTSISRWKRTLNKSNNQKEIVNNFVSSFKNNFRIVKYIDMFLEDVDNRYEYPIMLSNSIIQELIEDDLYDYQKNKFISDDKTLSDFSEYIMKNKYLMKLITKYVRRNGMYGEAYELAYMISQEFLIMIEECKDMSWRDLLDN